MLVIIIEISESILLFWYFLCTNKAAFKGYINDLFPFQDVKIHILDDRSTKTTLYRKITHIDQYLNGLSHCPLEHNRAVVRSLMILTDNIITTNEDRDQKKKHQKHIRLLAVHSFSPRFLDILRKKEHPKPSIVTEGQEGQSGTEHLRPVAPTWSIIG